MDGSRESWRQLCEFLAFEADAEIDAFLSTDHPENVVRVLAIRHGMGDHNAFHGMNSLVSEDAALNECGMAQAERVGDLLRDAGVIAQLGLVVVSPFTRALQTARLMLGADIGADLSVERGFREARAEKWGWQPSLRAILSDRAERVEAIVHPLCAEDTLAHSHVWRGNRGSTAHELSRRPDLAFFDFRCLGIYCDEQRVGKKNQQWAEKWWHHGPHSQETEASFRRRMAKLKRWLGQQALTRPRPLKVLLVCHGGVMQEAFGYRPNAPNCGFRAFDIDPNGRTRRVADSEWVEDPNLREPMFHVLSVVQQSSRVDGHLLYDIELSVGYENFVFVARESELRERLHDLVASSMSAEAYERLRLRGLFPRYAPLGRSDPAIYIQDYLEQLAIAMSDPAFDRRLVRQIDKYLLGGRLASHMVRDSHPSFVEGGLSWDEVACRDIPLADMRCLS
mmetsp:Transcript_23605/g.67668  ORF Transcript_23605/g.67668 Transcript_23605/m.67668 type:complete len:451 (-) Transcript_23605:58-1410(-)